jgi:integrase
MAGIFDKTIRSLVDDSRAKGRRIEAGHPEAEGLRVRVKADASGDGFTARWVWYAPRSADGKRKMHDLGAAYVDGKIAISAKEAGAQLATLRADLERTDRGLPTASQRDAKPMTLRGLLARFAWRELRRRREALAPLRVLKRSMLDILGDVDTRAIRQEDVIEVVERLQRAHRDAQAKKVLALVRQMGAFGQLPTVRAFPVSPAENLTERMFRFRRPERRDRLTPEELATLWRVLHDKPRDPRAETSNLALIVLLGTGRRTGELVQAKWSAIDLAAGIWRVPRENRKATKEIEARMPETDHVHLAPQVVRALHRLRALAPSSPWILASSRGSRSGHIGETTLARALRDMQLRGLVTLSGHGASPHAFRHTFKSTVEDQGWADVVAVELALGHVLPGILGTYGRATYATQRAAALDRWNAYLDGLAGIGDPNVVNLDAARG